MPATLERERLGREARPLPLGPGGSGRTFVLVSGLPRSGTSLMMQMLAAGGLTPKTDGERSADVDNPPEELAKALETYRDGVLATMRKENNVFAVLEVDDPALVADPGPWAEFVGAELLPPPGRMAGAVRVDLHRNRVAYDPGS